MGFVRKQLSVLRGQRERADKAELTLWSFCGDAQGLVGCGIIVCCSVCVLLLSPLCVFMHTSVMLNALLL